MMHMGAFGKVLPKKSIGIFITSPLPGTAWIAEIDLGIGVEGKFLMLPFHFPDPMSVIFEVR